MFIAFLFVYYEQMRRAISNDCFEHPANMAPIMHDHRCSAAAMFLLLLLLDLL